MKMKNVLYKYILTCFLVLVPSLLWGQLQISDVAVVHGTCAANATITVTVINPTGTVYYGLKGNNNEIYEIIGQTTNVFTGLPPGTYTISAHDSSTGSTAVTAGATITTSYVEFAMTQLTPGSSSTNQFCEETGTLRINVTGGLKPYRYKIINTTTNEEWEEFNQNATSYTFTGLTSGQYYVEVEDGCSGKSKTTSNVTVTSTVTPFNNIVFNKLEFTPNYIAGSSCSQIYVRAYSETSFKINNDANLSKQYPSVIKYRMEYPAGSGKYLPTTGWYTFYTGNYQYFYMDYDPANPLPYKIEAQNPCTGQIISSEIYDLPALTMNFVAYNYFSYTDFCTLPSEAVISLNVSSSGIANYNICNHKVEAVPRSGGATKIFDWVSGNSCALRGLTPGTTYDITIKSASGVVVHQRTVTTLTPHATDGYMSSVLYSSINYSTAYYGYNFGRNCDFNTTAMLTTYSANSAYSVNANHKVTYSILDGPMENGSPVTRPPITLTSIGSSLLLWDDLPYGAYSIKIVYGDGCREETKSITLAQTVTGFDTTVPVYSPGSFAGEYNVSSIGYFKNMQGNPYTSTSSYYRYYMCITNSAGVIVATSDVTYSNYEATILKLKAGAYKVKFYAYYNHQSVASNRCYYKEYDLVLPEYVAPTVNLPLSGGITCGGEGETGTLTVNASGTATPFMYAYRKKGTPTYSVPQTSNVFSGLLPGAYEVEISDKSGSVRTQELSIYSGSSQFVKLIGSLTETDLTTVCGGKSFSITVLSIGPVRSYQWYKNDVKIEGATGPIYTVASAKQSDIGVYKVVINNGQCDLESSAEITRVLPAAETPTITGPCTFTGASTILTAQTTVVSPSYQWYKNGTIISGAPNSNTYTATSAGIYSVIVTPQGACPSSPSDPFVLSLPVMYWKGTAEDHNWNNPENWVDPAGNAVTVIPSVCTEVHIPGGLSSYPSLDTSYTFREGYGEPFADKIIFHFGGEVAYQHMLTYNKAYVQYNWGYYAGNYAGTPVNGEGSGSSIITRDKWYMLAAPLKKMASGDFALGGYPLTWQAVYNAPHPSSGNLIVGDFSKAFSSNDIDLSKTNNALAVKVAAYNSNIGYNDHKHLESLKGILQIPYFENSSESAYHPSHTYSALRKESRFYYFNEKTLQQIASPIGTMKRGDEAYRFVYEDDLTKEAPVINVLGENVPAYTQHVTSGASTSKQIMVGNPFMASINSRLFFEANSGVLNGNAGYYLLTPTNQSWTLTEYKLENEIAPLQAFVITLHDRFSSADLVYPLEGSRALTGHFGDNNGRATPMENSLYIRTSGGNSEPSDYAVLSGDQEKKSLAVRKMIYPDSHKVSEVFLISPDKNYNLIDFLDKNENEIGLGVKSSNQKDVLSLEFENVSSFAHSTGIRPVLVDKFLKVEQDLTVKNKYEFNQRTTESNKLYSDVNRFALRLTPDSGIADETNGDLLSVIYDKNQLEVTFPQGLIQVDVYDLQGRLLHNSGKLSEAPTTYQKYLPLTQGVYIVKVKTLEGQVIAKKISVI